MIDEHTELTDRLDTIIELLKTIMENTKKKDYTSTSEPPNEIYGNYILSPSYYKVYEDMYDIVNHITPREVICRNL